MPQKGLAQIIAEDPEIGELEIGELESSRNNSSFRSSRQWEAIVKSSEDILKIYFNDYPI